MSQDEIKMVPVPKAPKRKPARASGSSKVARMKARLEVAPDLLVVDKTYNGKGDPLRAENSARTAANNLNSGKQSRWPNTEYYAAYQESPDSPGTWERLIGRVDHLTDEWKDFVEKPKKSHSKKHDEDDGAPVESVDEPTEAQEEVSDGEVSDPFSTSDQNASV